MDKVFFIDSVEEDFGRPQTAEVISSEIQQLFLAEIYKVVSLPHAQIETSVAVDLLPVNVVILIHAVHNAQVSGQNHKTAGVKSDYFNITAALFALFRCQHGISAVDLIPAFSVTAYAEIYLLAVRCDFFF